MKKFFVALFLLANFAFAGQISSFEDLQNFIKDGWEKGYFPKTIISHQGSKTGLKDINLEFRNTLNWDINTACNQHRNEIIIANNNGSVIKCNGQDNIYILNSNNNEINDPYGDDIVVLGNSNNKINLAGSAIIIANGRIGQNEIKFREPYSIDFQKSGYNATPYKSLMKGYNGEFPYEYHNFIIFGEGIKRTDLQWEDNTLINTKTGDSIKLNTKNVNLLFVSDQNPTIDLNFAKIKFKPYDINLTSENNINKVLQDGDFFYFASEFSNLKKAKLVDYKTIQIQNEIFTNEFIKNVEIGDKFIFVSECGNEQLCFLNVFDKELNLIQKLKVKGNIRDIKAHKNTLYLLQNYEFHEHNTFIYDIGENGLNLITQENNPDLYSMEIIGDLMFAAKWSKGFVVFNISDPHKLRPVKWIDEKVIINTKSYKNLLAIQQERNIFGLYEFKNIGGVKNFEKYELQKICETELPKYDENRTALVGNQPHSMLILGDKAFIANGKEGVFFVDLPNCKILDNFGVGEYRNGVFKINDNLAILNKNSNLNFISLRQYFPNEKFIEFENNKTQNLTPKIEQTEQNLSADKIQQLLFESSGKDDYNTTMKYCKMGGNPNLRGHDRSTPLEYSALLQNINSLKALLDCGGKITDDVMLNAIWGTDNDSETRLKILKLLDEHGGNFGAKDSDGCSMLHYAAIKSSLEISKFLIEKGVDINAKCRHNLAKSAQDWAKSNKKYPEVLEYLQNLAK